MRVAWPEPQPKRSSVGAQSPLINSTNVEIRPLNMSYAARDGQWAPFDNVKFQITPTQELLIKFL